VPGVPSIKAPGENVRVVEDEVPSAPRRVVRPPRDDDDKRSDSEKHGWGEDPHEGRRDRDWYERERPPHHG